MSLVGIATGMVTGLATVTPASGFIGVPGGLILSLILGFACYIAVDILRVRMKIDDIAGCLCRSVGGILGSLLVAWLALPVFGGLRLANGVSATSQFGVQLLSASNHWIGLFLPAM